MCRGESFVEGCVIVVDIFDVGSGFNVGTNKDVCPPYAKTSQSGTIHPMGALFVERKLN